MKKSEKTGQNLASKQYDPSTIEPRWQSKWEMEGIYHSDLDSANPTTHKTSIGAKDMAYKSAGRPFYNLMMFPYPSAEGLHIGGTRTFSGVDIYGRFQRMRGHTVFQPFGLDGFGIHAENYALKIGAHPMIHAEKTEENFYRQIKEIALAVDWDRTVETYKKDYYKWTQWIFVQLFKKGLAYRKKSPVNFCPSCKTVLADEQVVQKSIKGTTSTTGTTGTKESKISGDQRLDRRKSEEDLEKIAVNVCERCETEVYKKDLEQWFFRITKYADRLLGNIDGLNWTEKVKIAQRNWIGRSEGAKIKFSLKNISGQDDGKHFVEIFTTAIDTIYGVTFMVISPEVAKSWLDVGWKAPSGVAAYIDSALNRDLREREADDKSKTGVDTGIVAVNPFNDEEVPVWVADYVLGSYGTGAIMAVPAHDVRDYEFARKFGLPIKPVIRPKDSRSEATLGKDGFWDYPEIKTKYAEKSELFDSGEFSGLVSRDAKEKMLDQIEEKGYGKREATYHLRDWLISRQRYWGPPIPMIYCATCAKSGNGEQKEMPGWHSVSEKDLPVELPYIEDFKPLGTGVSPLGNHPEFYEVKCPGCGAPARRETDVSDTFLDSAWYFFRYISTEFDDVPFDKKRAKAWLPVHMYIGGAEHSVLHLLYARFITMFIHDLGLIDFEEPFARFYAHGLIIKDGAKMSKSRGNVVGPDAYVKKYGADTLRMYLHFLAPFDQEGDFRDTGVEGMNRFLKRVWKLMSEVVLAKSQNNAKRNAEPRSLKAMHQAIKDITGEIEALRFNTAIAHLMTWYNFLVKQDSVSLEEVETYLKLLAPFAPHMTEELYQLLRNSPNHAEQVRQTTQTNGSVVSPEVSRSSVLESIHLTPWPTYDEKYLVADTVTIPVQVNGKLRATLEISSDDAPDQVKVEERAQKDPNVAKFLSGKKIKKSIYVKGKVMNFVV